VARIGRVLEAHPGLVVLETAIGGTRVVDMLPGDQLPRIC
jgi:hydrogenase expression/formation protein HypE